jgi:hypothetical protein
MSSTYEKAPNAISARQAFELEGARQGSIQAAIDRSLMSVIRAIGSTPRDRPKKSRIQRLDAGVACPKNGRSGSPKNSTLATRTISIARATGESIEAYSGMSRVLLSSFGCNGCIGLHRRCIRCIGALDASVASPLHPLHRRADAFSLHRIDATTRTFCAPPTQRYLIDG